MFSTFFIKNIGYKCPILVFLWVDCDVSLG